VPVELEKDVLCVSDPLSLVVFCAAWLSDQRAVPLPVHLNNPSARPFQRGFERIDCTLHDHLTSVAKFAANGGVASVGKCRKASETLIVSA
jgi:hypothetical protein